MTEQQKIIKLCAYIKKNILHYDDTQKTPKYLILRLRGLSRGQFIANKTHEINAQYDWDTIYMAFVILTKPINDYLIKNKNKIKDETHLINLIMFIVEKHINDIANAIKDKKISQSMIEHSDNQQLTAKRGEYKRKTNDKKWREL